MMAIAKRSLHSLLPLLVYCLANTVSGVAAQEGKWALCGGNFQLPTRPSTEEFDVRSDFIQITADEAESVDQQQTTTARRNVQVQRRDQLLTSDSARYDKRSETLEAEGSVRSWSPGAYISGDRAHMDIETDEGKIDNASFMFEEDHASGQAKVVDTFGTDFLIAKSASYTTCNPGDEDWVMRASSLKLDRETEWGHARNARIWFKGVPIFYSPFLRFPLTDKRKSGFLAPSFGTSENAGTEVTVPYYWNIAPNQDATFAVRRMSSRGVMFTGEYRYLTPNSEGQLSGEYLPDDNKSEENSNRYAIAYDHHARLARGWTTDIDYNKVSDKQYLQDLGTGLDVAGTRFLNRKADLRYQNRTWNILTRVQEFQTVDDTVADSAKPYDRLPQILFDIRLPKRLKDLNTEFRTELVNFDRSAGVTGNRIDAKPTFGYPFRTAATFIEPQFSLRYTRYDLDDAEPDQSNHPDRTAPIFSVNSGVFFDRDFRFRDLSYRQTLEPELYYLYVPGDNQDDIPDFDTTENTFTFSQLFRDNRFSGGDRVGDANQLTLALTTRVLSPETGNELFRARVGQIRYFANRNVTLPGQKIETTDSSNIVGDVTANIAGRWRVFGELQWDPHEDRTDRGTASIRYKPDASRVLNLSYRWLRKPSNTDSINQTDLSFRWPMTTSWSAVGRWVHSLENSESLETFGGIEYNSCCWGLRLVGRRYLTGTEGEYNSGVFLQLELKGLVGIGRETATFLETSIPGYQNEF